MAIPYVSVDHMNSLETSLHMKLFCFCYFTFSLPLAKDGDKRWEYMGILLYLACLLDMHEDDFGSPFCWGISTCYLGWILVLCQATALSISPSYPKCFPHCLLPSFLSTSAHSSFASFLFSKTFQFSGRSRCLVVAAGGPMFKILRLALGSAGKCALLNFQYTKGAVWRGGWSLSQLCLSCI